MFSKTNLRTYEINHIRTSMRRCNPDGLASEIGRSKKEIIKVIGEIRANDKLGSLSLWASEKKRSLKNKTKRKLKGGM